MIYDGVSKIGSINNATLGNSWKEQMYKNFCLQPKSKRVGDKLYNIRTT